MGYVDENLMTGERIIHRTTLHWIVFLPAALVAVFGLFQLSLSAVFGALVVLLGLLLAVTPLVNYQTSEFAVTDKRVMIKVGWLSRNTLEMLLTKVENISVRQGIGGRILGYGTISVTGTGGTKESFKNITAPLAFRKYVQKQVSEAQVHQIQPRVESAESPERLTARSPRAERECPYCAEVILAKARACKHCGRDVEPMNGS